MTKRHSDRRPDQKPAERGPGNYDLSKDPSKPEAGRRMPEVPENRKGFGKPEAIPSTTSRPPSPDHRVGAGISSTGSGATGNPDAPSSSRMMTSERPCSPASSGRHDAEPGRDGRQQEGHETRRPREVEPTQR